MIKIITILTSILMLQGCITKIVTVPVKVAYKTTKGVVKGTAAVVGAIIPGGDDEQDQDKNKNKAD